MEGLHGRALDRAIHALGLPVGPGVVRPSQTMFDSILPAHHVERVNRAAMLRLRLVGEGDAIVGEDDAYFVREDLRDRAQECSSDIVDGREWNST